MQLCFSKGGYGKDAAEEPGCLLKGEQWTTPGTGLRCEILNDAFRQPESPEHTEKVVKH